MFNYATLLAAFASAFRAKIMLGPARKRRLGHRYAMKPGARYVPTRAMNRHGAPGSRLQRATGPGSYDAWKAELAAKRAAKRAHQ